MDYAALKTHIETTYPDLVTTGADESIAQAMNADLALTYVPTEVGTGTILETLGIAAGNALLDAIKATPDFRHVWALIEQGRLRLDSPVTRGALDMLAGAGVITVEQAVLLKAKAQEMKPAFGQFISASDVAKALRG